MHGSAILEYQSLPWVAIPLRLTPTRSLSISTARIGPPSSSTPVTSIHQAKTYSATFLSALALMKTRSGSH